MTEQFKAWDVNKEVWIPDFIINKSGKVCCISGSVQSNNYVDINTLKLNAVLVRPTGLYDKNGKMIFDGDIVDVQYNFISRQLVVFNAGAFNISKYDVAQCEIVGNKFENPKLLEAGE